MSATPTQSKPRHDGHPDFARRELEAAIFSHLATSRPFARRAFSELRDDDLAHHDLREAFARCRSAHERGIDLTTDPRAVTFVSALAIDAGPWAATSQDVAIEAVAFQAQRRKLDAVVSATASMMRDIDITPASLAEALDSFRLSAAVRGIPMAPVTGRDAVCEYLADAAQRHAGHDVGEKLTGIHLLDRAGLRMCPGDLVIVAARPGGGKTALACSLIARQMQAGIAIPGFLSLEMPRLAITQRLLACLSGIPYTAIQRGEMSAHDLHRHGEAVEFLAGSTLRLHDGGARAISVGEITGMARQWRNFDGIDILYIDQLSRIAHAPHREERIRFGRSVAALKELARTLAIPVVLLCQLRRPEEGKIRSPKLADLKECGGIEEDADIVLMPWRPEAEGDGSGPAVVKFRGGEAQTAGRAFVYCRKFRNGEPFAEALYFDGPTMTFDLARS